MRIEELKAQLAKLSLRAIGAGEPAGETTEEDSPQCDPASPDLVIVWEPAVLNDPGYALLVALLGDQERFTLGLLPDSGS
jgi:hypothetical protein